MVHGCWTGLLNQPHLWWMPNKKLIVAQLYPAFFAANNNNMWFVESSIVKLYNPRPRLFVFVVGNFVACLTSWPTVGIHVVAIRFTITCHIIESKQKIVNVSDLPGIVGPTACLAFSRV